jgi:hypothetical protein
MFRTFPTGEYVSAVIVGRREVSVPALNTNPDAILVFTAI